MRRKMGITLVIIGVLMAIVGAVLMHPAWGRQPRGERLALIEQSPNYRNGSFHNRSATPMLTSGKSRWRIMWENLTTAKPKDLAPEKEIVAVKTDLSAIDKSNDQLVWFGHSSYLMTMGGKTVLVDPVFTRGFPAGFMLKPFNGTDLYKPDDIPAVDYLIITHDHYDHLDYGTIRAIKERVGKVICPLGLGEHLEYWGVPADKIVEMDWDENVDIDGLDVTCLPARHFSGRFIQQNPTLWASFMLKRGGKTVYVGGDSGYDTHYKEIGRRFPDIDLALLENGQYNDEWRYIHMMPDLLPQAIHDLGLPRVQPVHNSKFALARHPWNEPVERANEAEKGDSAIHLLHAVIGKPIEY